MSLSPPQGSDPGLLPSGPVTETRCQCRPRGGAVQVHALGADVGRLGLAPADRRSDEVQAAVVHVGQEADLGQRLAADHGPAPTAVGGRGDVLGGTVLDAAVGDPGVLGAEREEAGDDLAAGLPGQARETS